MEIKVGEYVRTTKGYISKINDIDNFIWFDSKITCISGIPKYELSEEEFNILVKKHSPNIIDLIEIGDYVNGCLIVEINRDQFIKGQTNLWTNMIISEGEPFPNEYYKAKILEKDIKSIVTKEQFEEMEYKV